MPIVLSLSSLRLSPSAPDLLFPSASDLWFRALPSFFVPFSVSLPNRNDNKNYYE